MTIEPAPIRDPVIDKEGFANLSWTLFFNSLYEGDAGETWSPAFTNLTTVGTPTITGRIYRITRRLALFTCLIVPSTSTSSTAGTTYINNFPLTFVEDGVVFAVTGNLGDGPGHIVAANNRIYVPSWSAVTVNLTVLGIGIVQS